MISRDHLFSWYGILERMTPFAFIKKSAFAIMCCEDADIFTPRLDILDALTKLGTAAGVPFLHLNELFGDAPFTIGEKFSAGIAKLQRRTLIIGGGTLEGAVTYDATRPSN